MSNNLVGWECPCCGQSSNFRVQAKVWIQLTNDDAVMEEDAPEEADILVVECPECNTTGPATKFY